MSSSRRVIMVLLTVLAGFSASALMAVEYRIDVVKTELQKTLVIHGTAKPEDVTKALTKAFPEVAQYIKTNGIAASATPFARYFKFAPPAPVEFEAGFMVAAVSTGSGDIQLSELPAGRAAMELYVGPYENIGPSYDALHKWMTDHNEQPGGAPWEVYLNDPATVSPQEYRTVIYYPLK